MTGRHAVIYQGRHEVPDTRDGETYHGRHRTAAFEEWLKLVQRERRLPSRRRIVGK